MPLTRKDLWNQLKRGEIAPVYVLYGAETYLRDAAARYITDQVFGPGDLRDFNETAFSLSSSDDIKPALAAAEQLPMMSERRVVKITDVRVSSSGRLDTLKDDDEAFLSAYLAKPSKSSVVIFIADELSKNRRIAKVLINGAAAVEFEKLKDAELLKWARDEVTKCDSEIGERELRSLIASVGADLLRLTNEVNKLSAAALPDKRITAGLIDSLVANSREIDNWTLTSQLHAGDKTTTLRTLKKILDDGAEPLAILGVVAGSFRRMASAKAMMEKGMPPDAVGTAVRAYGQERANILSAARRLKAERVSRIFQRLAETDVAIKTSIGGGGTTGSRLQIEMLVCDLAHELKP